MANKQSVPGTALNGAMLRTARQNTPIPVEIKRELPTNNTLDIAIGLTEGVKKASSFMIDYTREQQAYAADEMLQNNRQQLKAANSPEEFEQLANTIEDNMRNYFMDSAEGKEFWINNGDRLLNAHRRDVGRIREQKNLDFAKLSLNDSLAQNQNLLAKSSGSKGELLLDRGLKDINTTPLLNDDEKLNYRQGFVRNGLLNLALNDPDMAISYADKYVDAGDEREALKQRLTDAKKLREDALQKTEAEGKRKQEISEYGQQLSLWAEKEKGNLSEAEFYVLTAEGNDDSLFKANEEITSAPLKTTYQLIKKMSNGETLSAVEARDAGQALVSAYQQKKIGLNEVADLQEKLMSAAVDKSLAEKYFNKGAYMLADKAFLPDVEVNAGDEIAEAFMEKKAQLMFEINDVYNAKREMITNVFLEQGGQLTPAYERRFNQQALRETRDELGLMENSRENLSFGALRRLVKNFYTGSDEKGVWQRFYDEAPYVDDKKALLKKIAAEEERKELSYPQFDNFAEVEAAGLEKGEKFYLRGRLAVRG